MNGVKLKDIKGLEIERVKKNPIISESVWDNGFVAGHYQGVRLQMEQIIGLNRDKLRQIMARCRCKEYSEALADAIISDFKNIVEVKNGRS